MSKPADIFECFVNSFIHPARIKVRQNKMKIILYICLNLSLIPAFPLKGQNDSINLADFIGDHSSILFDSNQLLEATLRFDITRLSRTRQTNDNQEALITYYVPGSDTITRTVRLRARGNFRRNFCDFPPIRLNFRKDELPGDKFHGVDRIKLVTHCKAGNSDYVLREYLVYRIFNVLTDYSFRVRLMKINYVNTRRPGRPFTEYAFLIEPVEFLTARTRSVEVTIPRLNQKMMKPEHMDRVAIFSYMIGNYDWSVPGLHNLVALTLPLSGDPSLGIVVPYDFDYCGLVNTTYAIPPETLPIKTVRERLYRGICRDEETFKQRLEEFVQKKDDIYNLIDEFPYLGDRHKRDIKNYLGSFFRNIEGRNLILYSLLRECVNL